MDDPYDPLDSSDPESDTYRGPCGPGDYPEDAA